MDSEVKQFPIWVQVIVGIYVFGSVLWCVGGFLYYVTTDKSFLNISLPYYGGAIPGVMLFMFFVLEDD
jgi:hypothetical protein